MVTAVEIILIILLVLVTVWGQYWYDRAQRLIDTITYILEAESEEALEADGDEGDQA